MPEINGFWRSNGAVFVILKSLVEIIETIGKLIEEHEIAEPKLAAHYDKYQDDESDEVMQEFAEIMENIMELESILGNVTDILRLTCSIELEARINMFCFFNIGEVAADAIETLSLVKKMEVAHSVLGVKQFKGSKPYEALNDLVEWRNLYAHGKCTDMPKDKLRKNHLVAPDKFPSPKDNIDDTIKSVSHYLAVITHLRNISQNERTSGWLRQDIEVAELLEELKDTGYQHLVE